MTWEPRPGEIRGAEPLDLLTAFGSACTDTEERRPAATLITAVPAFAKHYSVIYWLPMTPPLTTRLARTYFWAAIFAGDNGAMSRFHWLTTFVAIATAVVLVA
jgi:hypothetical protein